MLPLAEQGYGVLAFDLRAHGDSGGDRFAAAWDSHLDAIAAARYLQNRDDVDADRIGALGLSAGAHGIIYAAAKTDSIRALMVDSVGLGGTTDLLAPLRPEARPLLAMIPASWMRHRMIEAPSRSRAGPSIKEQVALIAPRPVLFVASGRDRMETAIARRYAARAGPGAGLWVLPDVDHIGGVLARPEEYAQGLTFFFNARLLVKEPTSW